MKLCWLNSASSDIVDVLARVSWTGGRQPGHAVAPVGRDRHMVSFNMIATFRWEVSRQGLSKRVALGRAGFACHVRKRDGHELQHGCRFQTELTGFRLCAAHDIMSRQQLRSVLRKPVQPKNDARPKSILFSNGLATRNHRTWAGYLPTNMYETNSLQVWRQHKYCLSVFGINIRKEVGLLRTNNQKSWAKRFSDWDQAAWGVQDKNKQKRVVKY